jgi:hypothetical protein
VVLVLAIIAFAVYWFFARHRPIVLPFNGLNESYGVAVDGAGNIYVTDDGNNQVLELSKEPPARSCCRSPGCTVPAAWQSTTPGTFTLSTGSTPPRARTVGC